MIAWLREQLFWWRLARLQAERRALLDAKRIGDPYDIMRLACVRADIDRLQEGLR